MNPFNDYKTAEDRLNLAGTNDIKGMIGACILGIVVAVALGVVLGALSALI